MKEFWHTLSDIGFWTGLLSRFRSWGPVAPILLAFMESVVPVLPLIGIVAVNVAAHGAVLGFLYSWIGASLGSAAAFTFFRKFLNGSVNKFACRHPKIMKARKWVDRTDARALFIVAIMPFTPIYFVNIAFGVSDYPPKKYISTLCAAKFFMIMILAFIGKSAVLAFKDPLFLILTATLIVAGIFLSKWAIRTRMDINGKRV